MATRKTTAKAPTTTSKAPKKAPVEPVKAQEQVQEQTAPMPTIRAKIDRLADFENSKDYIIENVARICDKYPLYNN